MAHSILLTSFTTWKPEQPSNSSDDLMEDVLAQYPERTSLHLLRKLPVDFQLASKQVIAAIQTLQPDAVLCCGMGESRSHLNIESSAVWEGSPIRTWVDVDALAHGLTITEISDDAGQYVCNKLYYDVLNHLKIRCLTRPCLFIHVPVLTADNRRAIATDFLHILDRVRSLV